MVSQHPSPLEAIAQRRARLAAVLHAREEEEEKRERAELHRLAPGYNPNSMLAPTHGQEEKKADAAQTSEAASTEPKEADPMDELVAQLEEMERGK